MNPGMIHLPPRQTRRSSDKLNTRLLRSTHKPQLALHQPRRLLITIRSSSLPLLPMTIALIASLFFQHILMLQLNPSILRVAFRALESALNTRNEIEVAIE